MGRGHRAGQGVVEGRDRVPRFPMVPLDWGPPRASCCKERTGKWHPEGKEGTGMEHCGVAQSRAVGTHGYGGRQAVAPID